jgi:hypothetical protein
MSSLFSGAGQPYRLVQAVQADRDRQERYNSVSPCEYEPTWPIRSPLRLLAGISTEPLAQSLSLLSEKDFLHPARPRLRKKLVHGGEPDSPPRPFIAMDWETRDRMMLPYSRVRRLRSLRLVK